MPRHTNRIDFKYILICAFLTLYKPYLSIPHYINRIVNSKYILIRVFFTSRKRYSYILYYII